MSKGWMRLAVGMFLAGALSAAAEEKIGVVDAQSVIKSFYKTAAATNSLLKLDEELSDAQRRMVAKLTEMDDECKKAIAESNDKALSEETRAKKRAIAEDKLAELKEYDLQVRRSEYDSRKKLDEQQKLIFKPIVAEVRQTISETAKELGLTLVFDGNETGLGSVIYFESRLSITDAVIKKLNKNAPPPAADPAAPAVPEGPAGAKQATK